MAKSTFKELPTVITMFSWTTVLKFGMEAEIL
jgi:hypothetical protein